MLYGMSIFSSVYGSVFYLVIGFYGLYVIGGFIVFIFLLVCIGMSKFILV